MVLSKSNFMNMLIWILLTSIFVEVHAQCTFQPPFNGSTWHDNTKGTLTFGTQYMTGWGFNSFKQTVNQWQCVNSTVNNFLVIRTRYTFRYERPSGFVVYPYGYLCLKLTNVTDTSYIYYQMQVQINDIGGERMKLSTLATLDYLDVCSETVSVPETEYHVLLKQGSEAVSAITCPNSLLFSGDYTYNGTNGVACDTSADVIDVCSNTSQIMLNYTTCTQQIAFSAGGLLLCVASITSGGYDYVTLLNMDNSFTTDTSRFACMSTDGSSASVAPGNCTATQTPNKFPTEADGTTATGHLLTFTNKYLTCGTVTIQEESGGLSGGQVAAIVICILLVVFFIISFIVIMTGCLIVAKVFFIVLYDLAAEPEDLKSPVRLPDIEAQLQDLKLSQENFLNGGPVKSHKKSVSVTVKVHLDGRGKAVLPPVVGKKGESKTLIKSRVNEDDKHAKTIGKLKDVTKSSNTKNDTKKAEVIDAKLDSSRKDTKTEASNKLDKNSPGRSPRKLVKLKISVKTEKTDELLSRNEGENVITPKKENQQEQTTHKVEKLELSPRKSFI